MAFLVESPYLAIAVPIALGALVALGGSRLSRPMAWVAMIGPLWILLTGIAGAQELLHAEEKAASPFVTKVLGEHGITWLLAKGVDVGVGVAMDGLTSVMLIVVGLVALMVMLFSVGYMHGDGGYARYYAVLSLFSAAMAGLVLADGFVGLFVAWELVGACSYLLIGFWFEKPSAAAAAMKAFIVTRVGDVGLFLALAILWSQGGGLGYADVMARLGTLAPATVTAIAILLFIGAAGKSAQFPLHIWLPDAMEGPTPVSALIHAATMVAAGVFLVARTWPIFAASESAMLVVLVIGTLTALGAATIGLVQRDIKRVLAYSTISQLGFMFAALGVGAWRAAMFHLVTHAAFKALLFLGSGSVIHATHSQDLHEMGGLAKKMPITATTWIIGVAALSGIPPLAGFFSKDEILHDVLGHAPVAGVLLVAASFLTAFYSTRATRLAFFGEYRGHAHPHESGATMALPLVILAACAAVAGFASGQVAELLGGKHVSLDPMVAGISTVVAVLGVAAGWFAYAAGPERDLRAEKRFAGAWKTLTAAYHMDAIAWALVVRPTQAIANAAYSVIDRRVVDAAVEGTGSLARRLGRSFGQLQNGDGQWYAALVGAGVIVLIALAVLGPQISVWAGR